MTNDDAILCGLEAIGAAYKISGETARRLCKSGGIPAIRLGGQSRLRRSAVDQHFDRPIHGEQDHAAR
jgi:excisionase family DNA binding protein